MESIGLIAGNGVLPRLFAEEARRRGMRVVAVALQGEADPALAEQVDALSWARVGQASRILSALKQAGVHRAVMAGGIGRLRSLARARPDLGAWRIAATLRSFRDDAVLRGVAAYFEKGGVEIVAPTDLLAKLLAPLGQIAGPKLSSAQEQDVSVGLEVASLLGKADVGQTVVVRQGLVLAVEAVDGTDETIRRGGRLGGAGAVVVKLSKPGQDLRFDLPAVGPRTIDVMADVGATVLALEAGKSVILDVSALHRAAEKAHISVLAVARPSVS